jgi:hypothetical protein
VAYKMTLIFMRYLKDIFCFYSNGRLVEVSEYTREN